MPRRKPFRAFPQPAPWSTPNPFQTGEAIERVLAAGAVADVVPMAERVGCCWRRADTLAGVITAEMGKTLGEAHAEVEKTAAARDWLVDQGPSVLADEPAQTGGGDQAYVSYLPTGTILAVMPWNLPIWQGLRAAGPVILSGNGFLLKQAPSVMGCAYALQDAYAASGFPPGLFAILNADKDAETTAIADPRVAAVTLTGSARAGAAVASTAVKALKKSLLELGGTDAFIVLADADLDAAVTAAVKARFGNAAQVCLAAKRIILEQPIAETFHRTLPPGGQAP